MRILLERYAYMKDRTMGVLYAGNEILYTVERPWIRTPNSMGGAPFESCVPDGLYELIPFNSPKHPNTWALENPALDVHVEQRPVGRYAILIHSGNHVSDVVGCIAPGLSTDDESVWHSRAAMDRIRNTLDGGRHWLNIKPVGAVN